MYDASIRLETFQFDKSPSKFVAPLNMSFILMTLDTSQSDRPLLKDVAPANIPKVFLSLFDTLHDDKSWLKDVARANMACISSADETSHVDTFPLKEEAS